MPAASLALALGCTPPPPVEAPVRGLAIPVRDPTPRPLDDDDARESPPDADPARPAALPAAPRETLASGLELITASSPGLPTVELRLIVRGVGTALTPAASRLALSLALAGGAGRLNARDVRERFTAAGSLPSLTLHATSAEIALTVAREQAPDIAALLLQQLREARFEAPDLAREKRLALAPTLSWWPFVEARHLVQGLASPPAPAEIDRLALAELKSLLKQRVLPSALSLVVVGEPDVAALKKSLDQVSAGWAPAPTSAPTPPTLSPRPAPSPPRVLLIDTPGQPLAQLWVLTAGPSSTAASWPAVRLLAEQLDGVRVPAALRASPPLALRPHAALLDRGAYSVLALSALADPARAPAALGALLEALRKSSEAMTDAELTSARRRAQRELTSALTNPAHLADELGRQASLRLGDGAWQRALDALASTDEAALTAASRDLQTHAQIAVVLGDAAQLAPSLTRLGEVSVLPSDRLLDPSRVLPPTPAPAAEKP